MWLRRIVASSAIAGACFLAAACSDADSQASDSATSSDEDPAGVGPSKVPADLSPEPPASAQEPSAAPETSAEPEPSVTPSPGDPAYAWPATSVTKLVNPTGWWLEPIPPPQNQAIAEAHPRVILVNTWYNVIPGSYYRDANGYPSFYPVYEPIPVDPDWPEGSVVILDADTLEMIESVQVYRTNDEMLAAGY